MLKWTSPADFTIDAGFCINMLINLLSAHLERSNERSKNEISSRTENMLDKQKDLATQVVIVRYLLLECIHNNYLSQNLFVSNLGQKTKFYDKFP